MMVNRPVLVKGFRGSGTGKGVETYEGMGWVKRRWDRWFGNIGFEWDSGARIVGNQQKEMSATTMVGPLFVVTVIA